MTVVAKQSASSRLWLWFGVALLECELWVDRHYPLRTQLRELLGLPLFHLLLSFATLALLLHLTRSQAWKLPQHWRSRRVTAHLLLALGVQLAPASLPVSCFLALFAILAATWLAAFLPFHLWSVTARENARWLFLCTLLSPLPPWLASQASLLWYALVEPTFAAVRLLLLVYYDQVVSDPAQFRIGTPQFVAEIEAGCSGYEGAGLITFFLAFYLILRRHDLHIGRAAMALPAAWILAWLLNVVRISALIMLGSEVSPVVARRSFHTQAGWLSFTLISLLLVGWMETSRWFWRDREQASSADHRYPALPWLAPFLFTLWGTLWVAALSPPDFPRWYVLKPLWGLASLLLLGIPRGLSRPDGVRSLLAGILAYLIWIGLVPHRTLSPGEVGWGWLLIRFVGGSLVVPLVEELAFRGYLLRRLSGADFESLDYSQCPPRAQLLSAVVFAAFHHDFVAALLCGLIYGRAARWRGGLSNSILAHSLTNFAIALQVVIRDDWYLWL